MASCYMSFPSKYILSVLKWVNSEVQLTIKHSDQQNTAFVVAISQHVISKVRLLHVSLNLQVTSANDNHEIA